MHRAAILLALAVAPVSAGATLIGDTVTVRFGTDSGAGFSELSSVDIVVAAGTSDATMVGGSGSFPHIFDAEASSFTLTQASTGWGEPFVFNGYVVDSLDWVGMPGGFIGDISFTTNVAGLTDDRVTFTDHAVLIDFQGLSVNNGFITVELTAIPEPSTALLLGAGVLVLAAARCRALELPGFRGQLTA